MRAVVGDVAIVGMACLFPGADGLAAYWRNILAKVDAVSDPPEDWYAGLGPAAGGHVDDGIYCKRGGYLGPLARFRPADFGVMPTSIEGGDPDQFLALRIAHEALADAGYVDRPLDRERTEVILGRGAYINRGNTNMLQHGLVLEQTVRVLRQVRPDLDAEALEAIRRELRASLPPCSPDMAPGLVPNVVSGRIANRLDFMGPSYTVDAACASALIALEIGSRDLLTGRCDVALVGGVHVSTPPPVHLVFCQLGALSKANRLRPFHRDADGTVLGEGLGIVVVKRREDAERDGDRIYALVRGVGTASDGRALGLLAPRLEGEVLAMRRAYEASGVSPRSVGLIEAHGTGTPVGDATELEALRQVLGEAQGRPWCAVGSVKSMIGHTLPAAGMAGLIKTSLALYHKVLPPTLHCEEPTPALHVAGMPIYVNTETRPWIHGAVDGPRRAGVNAFGFGGINAHAVLEEHPGGAGHEQACLHDRWDSEALVLRGPSREALEREARRVHAYLEARPDVLLKDLAFTLNVAGATVDPDAQAWRLGVVAESVEDARAKLRHAAGRLADPTCRRLRDTSGIYFFAEPLGPRGQLAFLFPGEGSQYPGMLGDLCIHFPEVRECFDLMDRAFAAHPRGYRPSQVVFPPPGADGSDERLWQMDAGAESVFVASQGMLRLLRRLGIEPDAAVGHSTGEYSALLAAGAIAVDGEARLIEHIVALNAVYERLAAEGQIPGATLLAVGAVGRDVLAAIVAEAGGALTIAMDNCPNQVVLCGQEAAVALAAERVEAAGGVASALPFGRAYHTPMFEPATEAMRAFFDGLPMAAPALPLYSCASAAPYPRDPARVRELALLQWARPVRFRETIEAMHAAGVRIFVEVGPRSNLTGFVDDVLRRKPAVAVAANVPHRTGIAQLNHLVALLAAHGVGMRLDPLYARRSPRPLTLDPSAPRAAPAPGSIRLTLGLPSLSLPDDTRARPTIAPRPDPAPPGVPAAPARGGHNGRAGVAGPSRPFGTARGAVAPGAPAGAGASRASVVRAHLALMDQFLATQEQVLSGYLAPAAARPPRLVEAAAGRALPLPPFIGRIVSLLEGKELVAEREIALDEDGFLEDHTLGGAVSAFDPALLALPVMPLTMSMEILAEAAAVLVPGRVVVGMEEVRAHRWMALPRERLALSITARRLSADAVRAEVREASTGGASGPPIVEGTVRLADRYPEAPVAGPFPLRSERPSRWHAEELYSQGMFHGPRLRGVRSVDRWGEDGTEATLEAPPADRLFRSRPDPGFVIDPVLLDAAGQLVGYWTGEHLTRGFNVFPYRVAALRCYGPPLRPGERARGRARIAAIAPGQLRSDIDAVGADGRLRFRLEGWEDRQFDFPPGLYRLRIAPHSARLAEPWGLPAALGADGIVAVKVTGYPDEFLASGGGIWRAVLAQLILGRPERAKWEALDRRESARNEWLLGRAAIKDAVRALLEKRRGLSLPAADVEVVTDEHGRPTVTGPWLPKAGGAPAVSLAHVAGLAVAVAADGERHPRIGIDVERLGRVRDDFAALAFSDEERRILATAPGDPAEWSLRGWCAKEAVAKALGRGLLGDPGSLVVRHVDGRTGWIRLRLAGLLAGQFPDWTNGTIVARTGCEDGVVMALSLCERGEQ